MKTLNALIFSITLNLNLKSQLSKGGKGEVKLLSSNNKDIIVILFLKMLFH